MAGSVGDQATVAVVDCGTDDRARLQRLVETLPTRVAEGPPDADEIVDRAAGATVLATLYTYTSVTESSIARLPELRSIATRTAGYSHIDIEAAAKRGITVTCVPEAPVIAIGEYTIGVMIAASRDLMPAIAGTRAGEWQFVGHRGRDLRGRVLGVVGLGGIGSEVARLGRALGMRVIGWSRSRKDIEGVEQLELEEVLAGADFVSVNLALAKDNVGFLDAELLRGMKPGAYLINTARGELVDLDALCDLLREGRLSGACLDVLPNEPVGAERLAELASVPNLWITPHVSWHTEGTLERQFEGMTDNIVAFCRGEPVNDVTPQQA
jgi:phosphoglycerate dehydrogenase-like enzyme